MDCDNAILENDDVILENDNALLILCLLLFWLVVTKKKN